MSRSPQQALFTLEETWVWERGPRLSPSKTPLQAATPQGLPEGRSPSPSFGGTTLHWRGNVLPVAPNSRQGRGSHAVLQSPAVLVAPVAPQGPFSRVVPLCQAVPGDRRTGRAEVGTPQDPGLGRGGGESGPAPGWWRLLEGSGFGEPWGVPATAHLGTLLALPALAPHRSHGSLDEGTETPGAARWPGASPARSPSSPHRCPSPSHPSPFPYSPSVRGDLGDPAPLMRLADPEMNPVGIWGEGRIPQLELGETQRARDAQEPRDAARLS